MGIGLDTVTGTGGWSLCFSETYDTDGTSMETIKTQCYKPDLMMACRVASSTTIDLLAWAPRGDVLYDTGTGNVPHNSTGSGWYYYDSYSWGFAPEGSTIARSSCDTGDSADGYTDTGRLCWHTSGGNLNGGWRCGDVTTLNDDDSYERLVFHR